MRFGAKCLRESKLYSADVSVCVLDIPMRIVAHSVLRVLQPILTLLSALEQLLRQCVHSSECPLKVLACSGSRRDRYHSVFGQYTGYRNA